MAKYLVAYLATAVVFFGLDFIWLSNASHRFYRVMLGDLLTEKPNLLVSALFYFVYVGGVVIFAVGPALNGGVWTTAGTMHRIGESESEMLDWVPARLRVIRTSRPKYACRV